VEQLHHETRESLEGTWYPYGGADLNEDSFGGVNINLKLSSLINRRIEEGKEALR
jgi:hypothetical protein